MPEFKPVQTTPPRTAVKPLVIPKIPQMNSSMGGMNEGTNAQQLLKNRHKVPVYIKILKAVSLVLITISGFTFFALKADTHKENTYLEIFGIENTGISAKNITEKQKKLSDEITESSTKTAKLKHNIETENWALEKPFIEEVIKGQYTWYDKDNKMGLIDSIQLMETYFNKNKELEKSILQTNDIANTIEISNLNISRANISFSVTANQIFNRTFYLGTEFVKVANSFPTFKNGSINNFTKKEGERGQEMTYNLKLDIQQKDEVDENDEYFVNFSNWQNKNAKKTKKTSSSKARVSRN